MGENEKLLLQKENPLVLDSALNPGVTPPSSSEFSMTLHGMGMDVLPELRIGSLFHRNILFHFISFNVSILPINMSPV